MFCECTVVARGVGLFDGFLAARRSYFSFIRLAGPFAVGAFNSVFLGFQVFRVF